MASSLPTLGKLLRNLRAREGWTLKKMSQKSGIPVSTLSKVENGRSTLGYDKLLQASQRLGLQMSEFFADGSGEHPATVTARRSIGKIESAVRVETPNYDYYYLCAELRRKRMVPVIFKIRAKTRSEFADFVRHAGEEFIYVIAGTIVVNTEFYDPMILGAGQSIYLDSSMGHAYFAAENCDEAQVLGIMSSADDELFQSLMTIHEKQKNAA